MIIVAIVMIKLISYKKIWIEFFFLDTWNQMVE